MAIGYRQKQVIAWTAVTNVTRSGDKNNLSSRD